MVSGMTWKAFIDLYCAKLNLHICIPLIISAVASITLAIQVKAETKNNAEKFNHVHYRIDAEGKRIDLIESDVKELEKAQAMTAKDVIELKLERKYGRFIHGKSEDQTKESETKTS